MTQVAIKVLEAVYSEKTLMQNEIFEFVYLLDIFEFQLFATQIALFCNFTEFYLNDHLTSSLRMAQDTIAVLKVLFPKKTLIKNFDKRKIIRI